MQTRRPTASRISAVALACAGTFFALSAAQAAEPSYFAVVPVSGAGAVGQLRPVKMVLAGATPPAATVGVPYEFNLGALLSLDGPEGTTPDKVNWSVLSGKLPAGLELTANRISGVPAEVSAPGTVAIRAEYRSGYRDVEAMQGYAFEVMPVGLADFGGYRAWADGTFARSCNEYRVPTDGAHAYDGTTGDGVYRLAPNGLTPFDARCDMTTDGGGWTVFQRRFDGSTDFYRSYAEYVAGFGAASGEYWLGLERVRVLLGAGKELWVDLGRYNGAKAYARYASFKLGAAAAAYPLTVAGYSGTAGDSLGTVHNGRAFTTYDKDNDTWLNNCAVAFHGAWWFQQCHHSNLNGYYYGGPASTYNDGGSWKTFSGAREYLTSSEMKLR